MLPKEQFSLTVPKFFHSPAYFQNSPVAVWDLTLIELALGKAIGKSLGTALGKPNYLLGVFRLSLGTV